jgi:hypothetical protein
MRRSSAASGERVEKVDVELLNLRETGNTTAGARLDHHVFVWRVRAAAVSESPITIGSPRRSVKT